MTLADVPGLAGKGPGGRHGLSESFKTIVRRAGISLQEVQGGGVRKLNKRTFHALRHSLVSALGQCRCGGGIENEDHRAQFSGGASRLHAHGAQDTARGDGKTSRP